MELTPVENIRRTLKTDMMNTPRKTTAVYRIFRLRHVNLRDYSVLVRSANFGFPSLSTRLDSPEGSGEFNLDRELRSSGRRRVGFFDGELCK